MSTSMGKASSEMRLMGMRHTSSRHHAGQAAALRGLGCMTVYIINGILCASGCWLAMGHLVHWQV